MSRSYNSTANGYQFPNDTVQKVWAKRRIGLNHSEGYDTCGARITLSDYGNTNSQTGWEVDHIIPVAKGGTDHIDNLQPLQWQNNRGKRDNHPNWTCTVGRS